MATKRSNRPSSLTRCSCNHRADDLFLAGQVRFPPFTSRLFTQVREFKFVVELGFFLESDVSQIQICWSWSYLAGCVAEVRSHLNDFPRVLDCWIVHTFSRTQHIFSLHKTVFWHYFVLIWAIMTSVVESRSKLCAYSLRWWFAPCESIKMIQSRGKPADYMRPKWAGSGGSASSRGLSSTDGPLCWRWGPAWCVRVMALCKRETRLQATIR